MDLWTAVVIIVLIASVSGVVKSTSERKKASEAADGELQEVKRMLKAQEKRIANLESILYEMEKERPFDKLGS